MKQFFRFWFKIDPHSQPLSIYTYAEDLAGATEKITARLNKEYGPAATLTNRVESFELISCNAYARSGCPVSQSLLPADVLEVLKDLEAVPRESLDSPTRRIVRDFEHQGECIRARNQQPLIVPEHPRIIRGALAR